MNAKVLKLGIVFLLLFCVVGSCDEDNDYDPESVIGKWRLMYTVGGVVGTSYPKPGEESIWEFTSDSIVKIPESNNEQGLRFETSGDTLRYFSPQEMLYLYEINKDTLRLNWWSIAGIDLVFKREK